MQHEKELLKWLDEYYDKERKANFRKNVDDDIRRSAIITKLAQEEPQERYHDYIARRYRELEEK
tara:strand:+ start:698 stop:889 length:192 start_codon:yes stop_codon:yes gene_type:complete